MSMNVVSKTRLREFWGIHRSAEGSLTNWHNAVTHATWTCFADVKGTYNSADQVNEFVVFDVGSDRIVASIAYSTKHVYIKHIFTHSEYDKWTQGQRKK